MNIDHLSVSRHGVIKECPQKYKYKYHLRLTTDEPEPYYFAYGTMIHKIAEEFVRGRGQRDLYDIAHDVLNGVIPMEDDRKAPPLDPQYRDRFPDHLYAIQKLTDSIGFDGLLEWEFEYDLLPPRNYIFMGFIDRLIIQDDKYWIIDYKTTQVGKWRKTQANVAEDLQLRAYAMVVRRHFKVPAKNIKTALYYVDGAELVGAQFSEETLDKTELELANTYVKIKGMDAGQVWGTPGEWCNRCDYRKICPFFSLVRK